MKMLSEHLVYNILTTTNPYITPEILWSDVILGKQG